VEHEVAERFAVRLRKAWRALAAGAGLLGAALAGFGWAWSAGLFDGVSASELASRDAAAREAEHEAFTEAYVSLAREARNVTVQSGDTFASVLTKAGASADEANAAIASVADVYNTRHLRVGLPISVYFQHDGPEEARLVGLAFRSEPGASVTANRTAAGGFAARQVLMPLTYEIARIAAKVDTSLYASALELGATDREVAALADAFAYDVDFQRDVQPGDNFELVFERFYDDQGATVRTGDLLFVALDTRRGPRNFYSFAAPGDSKPAWYDVNGKSAQRFLMKTPINGARLSSGFGMRLHPILGYSRMHRGTDFAAAVGTPVMAAGEGVVLRASPFGTYGNYIRLSHGDNYDTAYAHLSRFAAGVHAGARVRQGQVIGYVGTTGRSTGPHLHYEVLHAGQQINPMGMRMPTGRNLEGRDLELFKLERARIDRLRGIRSREDLEPATTVATAD
jgi:murein DD-endopeptidase MepM/ murein hydrolase activator NlpD